MSVSFGKSPKKFVARDIPPKTKEVESYRVFTHHVLAQRELT
jgi:hypothetical protein